MCSLILEHKKKNDDEREENQRELKLKESGSMPSTLHPSRTRRNFSSFFQCLFISSLDIILILTYLWDAISEQNKRNAFCDAHLRV